MKVSIDKHNTSVILALCIIFCMGMNVQAATHKPGCAAKSTRLVCGSVENTLRGSHYLHTNVYCTTKTYVRTHKIVCSGCGVAIRRNIPRQCSRTHQYCPEEFGLCKHWLLYINLWLPFSIIGNHRYEEDIWKEKRLLF